MNNDILAKLNRLGAETDDALGRFMDDKEMYLKYVCGFPTEPTMGRLVAAVEATDYASAEKAVHALKGIVNNLGFLPLADAAVDMLQLLREGDTEEALEAYGELRTQYRIFTEAIISSMDGESHE